MASPQMDRIAESAFVKIAPTVISGVLSAVVIGLGGRLVDRLDRMETLLAAMQTDKATMDLRVKTLEALVPERGAAIKTQGDKILMLEFKVEDLQRQLPQRKR